MHKATTNYTLLQPWHGLQCCNTVGSGDTKDIQLAIWSNSRKRHLKNKTRAKMFFQT